MSYVRGEDSKNRSREFFAAGFLDVFTEAVSHATDMSVPGNFIEKLTGHLYDEARCGITHEALTRRRILLSYGLESPIAPPSRKALGASRPLSSTLA
jgi:hypothetical protein